MVFATLLIVAGCVGEFIFGSAATNDETSLRQDAERRIGEAATATEKLRSDNLRLEAEISPRGLSDADIKEINDDMKPFNGRQILVKSYLGDIEGHRVLFLLMPILAQAGLKPTAGQWSFDESSTVRLLLGMEIDAPPEQKDLADALQKAFLPTKLGIRPQWYAMAPGTALTLYIGVKPFPLSFAQAPAGGSP
jgi:hypothetical protein